MEISIEKIAIIISAAIASVVLFLYTGISLYIRDKNKKKVLIEKIQNSGYQIELQDNIAESLPAGARASTLNFFEALGGYFLKGNTAIHSQTKINLLRAGLHRDESIAIFWGVKCALGIVLPVTFFLLRVIVFKLIDPTITAGVCIGLAITGFYLPNVFLKIKTSARQEKIFQGLPDALDILVVCVEAGMGLDAAINRVAEEIQMTNGPLSEELKTYTLELRAGKTRQESLKSLAMRVDIEEIKNFTTLLIQTDKFGTSIAQALRVYSDSFRTKRFMMAEERAAKLPVKLVVPLVLCIFPALFVVIAAPAVIKIFHALIKH